MLIAAAGFAIMAFGSLGLLTPDAQAEVVKSGEEGTLVSANWLISTYLVLTFAELLLSPMGISFVSKVAPPKLKGMMMGGWFVATAIGNALVSVGGSCGVVCLCGWYGRYLSYSASCRRSLCL